METAEILARLEPELGERALHRFDLVDPVVALDAGRALLPELAVPRLEPGGRTLRSVDLQVEPQARGELVDRAALLDALRARVRAELGPDATVREHPDGGLVAEAPGRRLDLSLPALADDAVDALGGAAAALWAP